MSDDTIKRSDAIKAINLRARIPHDIASAQYAHMAINAIRSVPSADRPPKVVAQVTFDKEKLREIVKEAVERFKEEYEITDRPQGYWIKVDVATYRCSECGKIQIADDVNELNFCCCCGSRNKARSVKGADDER